MNIAEKIQIYAIAFLIILLVPFQSGVSISVLKEEAKRQGKLKEMEEFERRVWIDVAIGFIILVIALVILK